MFKKNLVKALLTVFVSVFAFQAVSQMKQKVADRLYDELAYFKAVKLYEDLASRKRKATTYQMRRTAECYRLIGDTKNAEIWYAKTTSNDDAMADDYYYYAQMLKANEKYTEAQQQLEKYAEKKTKEDDFSKKHLESKGNYVEELNANKGRYTIKNAGKVLNSEDGDYSPVYMKDKSGNAMLVFISSRKNMSAYNKKSNWDGEHFTDVWAAPLSDDWTVTGKPKLINKEVRSKYHEGPVSFSNEGTVMYLTRSNYLNKKKGLSNKRHNNLQIYIAKKEGEEWGELKPFKYNNDDYSTAHPTVTEDGNTMYFVSDMQEPRGGNGNKSRGGKDIWKCEKKPNGEWGLPENVSDLNSIGDEMFPQLGPDGILYFASDGHLGLGGLDLYRAEPTGDGWDFFNMGAELNTNYDDFGLVVDPLEEKGFFSSNRKVPDAIGDDDIYSVKILFPFGTVINGFVVDDKTGEPLPGAEIKIIDDKTGEVIQKIVADSTGFFRLRKRTEKACKIIVEKDKYEPQTIFSFKENDKTVISKDTNVVRLKKYECGLLGLVTDAETDQPVDGVRVTVVNNTTGEKYIHLTDGAGKFVDSLVGILCPGGEIDYTLKLCKIGYLSSKFDFKYNITKPGIIDLNTLLKSGMIKIQKERGDVRKLCNIEEIRFDYNSDDIRPDAAVELDKLVQCMQDFPVLKIRIEAHTDCQGNGKYNLRLSKKRAKSCERYVRSKGISKYKIASKGYGETKPKVDCGDEGPKDCYKYCDEEQWKVNRRIEFNITGLDEAAQRELSNDPDMNCNK